MRKVFISAVFWKRLPRCVRIVKSRFGTGSLHVGQSCCLTSRSFSSFAVFLELQTIDGIQ
jgi:hypothetical protein